MKTYGDAVRGAVERYWNAEGRDNVESSSELLEDLHDGEADMDAVYALLADVYECTVGEVTLDFERQLKRHWRSLQK